MSFGTGALMVGRGPEHFSSMQGGIHGNPVHGNHLCGQPQGGTITLKEIQWNIVTDPVLNQCPRANVSLNAQGSAK